MIDDLEFDMEASDIGEIIEIIRIQYLKMNEDTFCHKLGINNKTLFIAEQGKGAHGMMILNKINKTFPTIKIKMSVEFK